MDFGVHLRLADLGQGLLNGHDLRLYTATAAELGFDMVSANDHLVWRSPWLDGLTSLAGVLGSAGGMKLAGTSTPTYPNAPGRHTRAQASYVTHRRQ
jgi:hypothetical protein